MAVGDKNNNSCTITKKKWGKDALLLLSEGGDGVMAKLEVCSTMVGVAAISTTMQRR